MKLTLFCSSFLIICNCSLLSYNVLSSIYPLYKDLYFLFQTSVWGWQWILPVSQRVFPQPEDKKADKSWVGNNQETDGETQTVCCDLYAFTQHFHSSCLSLFFSDLFSVWSYVLFLPHPGVHQRSLLKSGQHWDRRGRRCACCSKENCLTCRLAKTFLMKSPYHSS